MNRPSFNRSMWLLNTIYQAGPEGLTFEEIGQKWLASGMSNGKKYPLRSFHNHRKEIHNTFNIAIHCRKNTNRYFIRQNDTSSLLMMKVLGLMNINLALENNSKDYISYSPNTGGEGFLFTITSAIRNKNLLKVIFTPNGIGTPKNYDGFKPLGIKEYKKCWYLLGQLGNGTYEYVNLAFTNEVSPLEETFLNMEEDTIQELLVENYGSRLENIPTEEITFKTSTATAQQLIQFPIHPSQRILENKPTHTIFYLNVKPTSDFILDLMSFGTSIEIITPVIIKEKIANEAKKFIKKNQ